MSKSKSRSKAAEHAGEMDATGAATAAATATTASASGASSSAPPPGVCDWFLRDPTIIRLTETTEWCVRRTKAFVLASLLLASLVVLAQLGISVALVFYTRAAALELARVRRVVAAASGVV